MPISPDVVNVLVALTDHTNPSAHHNALQALNSSLNSTNESFSFFITNFAQCMSSTDNTVPNHLRQIAGYLLKNNINSPPYLVSNPLKRCSLTTSTTQEVQNCLLTSLQDPDNEIRKTASTVISSAISNSIITLESWPNLLNFISSSLTGVNNNSFPFHGALLTILKISQDSPNKLDTDTLNRPLNQLVPILLNLFTHNIPAVRKRAIQTIQSYVEIFPHALAVNIEHVISNLGKLASDQSSGVRQEVNRPLNQLVPILLNLFTHNIPAVRKRAIQTIQSYVEIFPHALAVNIEHVISNLGKLASDQSSGVRQEVATTIVHLLDLRAEYITKHLSPICEFMLVSLSDADEGVGLAATEFFFSLFSSTMVNEQRRKLVTSSFNLLQVSERASERA